MSGDGRLISNLPPRGHESLVKVLPQRDERIKVLFGGQKGGPDVERAGNLSESVARNHTLRQGIN